MALHSIAEIRVRRPWVLPFVGGLCRWWLGWLPDRWIDRALIVVSWLSATEYRFCPDGAWRSLRWE